MPLYVPGGRGASTAVDDAFEFRDPPDVFNAVSLTAARVLRDASITNQPSVLALFDANSNLTVVLNVDNEDVYESRRNNAWVVTFIVPNSPLPGDALDWRN